ncbi:hypothetical protein PV05_09850 [Exophiala xenobiotica]|uniref:NTF2-like domain-containing protein n=1 Tax=Exophiala xenobiotica TaxID=348802 RepID=A0A0D2E6N3_9EURO|nr:uncharacterized protein PV05_09850 [Exophiala xenobiotica]KIW51098.1 hypothetical protein PV05_09850 [Exophiala xenobiotica]
MKYLVAAASLALASAVSAAPSWADWVSSSSSSSSSDTVTCPDVVCPTDSCLQQSDAEDIVSKFITIIQHKDIDVANATAQALLADSFFEKSDSIDILAGIPVCCTTHPMIENPACNCMGENNLTDREKFFQLGTDSFSSKAAYIAGVLSEDGPTNVTTIQVMPAGCNNVLWYWMMYVGLNQLPVRGMNLMQVNDDKQLLGQFLEFSSVAWGIDTGYSCSAPGGQPLPLV